MFRYPSSKEFAKLKELLNGKICCAKNNLDISFTILTILSVLQNTDVVGDTKGVLYSLFEMYWNRSTICCVSV